MAIGVSNISIHGIRGKLKFFNRPSSYNGRDPHLKTATGQAPTEVSIGRQINV